MKRGYTKNLSFIALFYCLYCFLVMTITVTIIAQDAAQEEFFQEEATAEVYPPEEAVLPAEQYATEPIQQPETVQTVTSQEVVQQPQVPVQQQVQPEVQPIAQPVPTSQPESVPTPQPQEAVQKQPRVKRKRALTQAQLLEERQKRYQEFLATQRQVQKAPVIRGMQRVYVAPTTRPGTKVASQVPVKSFVQPRAPMTTRRPVQQQYSRYPTQAPRGYYPQPQAQQRPQYVYPTAKTPVQTIQPKTTSDLALYQQFYAQRVQQQQKQPQGKSAIPQPVTQQQAQPIAPQPGVQQPANQPIQPQQVPLQQAPAAVVNPVAPTQ